jgi:hypothetical protein
MSAPLPAPTLGDLLVTARREAHRFAAWLDAADPDLARRLAANLDTGETPAQRVRAALADFAAEADDANWATLLSAVRASPDPGLAMLRQILLRALAAEAAR